MATPKWDFPKSDGDDLYGDEVNAFSPIGVVVAWLKSYANTPALPEGWVECNGQTLSDSDSVYDGQTIPDLNGSSGTNRFLRGSTTSGSTGGTETHTHDFPTYVSGGGLSGASPAKENITNPSGTLPSYYEVVWVMRVK